MSVSGKVESEPYMAIGNRTIRAKAELDAYVGQTMARIGAKALADNGALEDQVRGHILIEDSSGG